MKDTNTFSAFSPAEKKESVASLSPERNSPESISSLSYSSSGGASSEKRKQKTKKSDSPHKYREFYRENLFPVGKSNLNIDSIDSYFGEETVLSSKIKEIISRDFDRITPQKKGDNLVRASLICYKKGDIDGSFQEIKIIPPSINMEELSKKIIDRELPIAKRNLERLLREKTIECQEKAIECDEILRREEMLNEVILKSDTIKRLKNQGENKRNSEEQDFIVNFFKEKKILTEEELEEIKPREFQKLNELFFKKIEQAELEKSEIGKNARLKDYRSVEEQREICYKFLEEDDLIIDSITNQRGHSEDYLYQALISTGYFSQLRGMINNPECNRFFLVTSSERESCSRCSNVMEDIQEFLYQSLSDIDRDIKVKVLYFSKASMRTSDSHSVKSYDDKLEDSSFSEDEKSVVNFSPLKINFEIFSGQEKELKTLDSSSEISVYDDARPRTPEITKNDELKEISPDRTFVNHGIIQSMKSPPRASISDIVNPEKKKPRSSPFLYEDESVMMPSKSPSTATAGKSLNNSSSKSFQK